MCTMHLSKIHKSISQMLWIVSVNGPWEPYHTKEKLPLFWSNSIFVYSQDNSFGWIKKKCIAHSERDEKTINYMIYVVPEKEILYHQLKIQIAPFGIILPAEQKKTKKKTNHSPRLANPP